jgi:hypothetical protein
MAKKDNNGYIGNPTLGLDNQGIISRNKNFDTRFFTQNDAYSTDTNLMSSPPYKDTTPLFTGSATGGGSGSIATASLSNGSIANMITYTGGTGYPASNLNVTMSFSNGGGQDAAAYVSTVSSGVITAVVPLYSIQDVIIADGGGPYSTAPTLSFSAPTINPTWRPLKTATGSATITNGKVTGVTITTSGSNYISTSFPTITVSGGGLAAGGTQAVLVPVLRSGRGYTSNPTLTITSPTGTGAVISSSLIAGIGSIGVINGGGGYTTPPTVQIQGAALQDTSAVAVLSGNTVSTISVTSGSSRFSTAPSINISGGLPPLPAISNNQIVAWYGVYNNNSNFVGLQISTNGGGGYTVNWGDGTSNNYNSAATGSKQYTTASFAALTSSIYSVTDLYKPALITVTLSGSATSFSSVNFSPRPTLPTGSLVNGSNNSWKSIKMAGNLVTSIVLSSTGTILHPGQLETFEYSGSNSITNFTSMFANCRSLVEVVSFYTTNGTTFSNMFQTCPNLQKLPPLDFTNANNAQTMFNGCNNLKEITLLNSQNVTSWSNTFNACYTLQKINATFSSAVTTYNSTFANCYSLEKHPPLNVSNNTSFIATWQNCYSLKQVKFIGNTSKVSSWSTAFNNCYQLESLPSTLDLSANSTMSTTFSGCLSLKTCPIFTNTRSLTDITSMFQTCRSLVTIPWFDTINVTSGTNLFNGAVSLRSIPKLNFARLTNCTNMFTNCTNLVSVPALETSNATSFASMFQSSGIREAPFLNTSKGTDFSFMFSSCTNLAKVPAYDLGQATTVSGMFQSCTTLTTIPIFNLTKCTSISNMFGSCIALKSVPYLDTAVATSFASLFANCTTLMDIGGFNSSKVTDFGSCFANCSSLKNIPLMDTSRGTSFSNMFQNGGTTEIPALNMTSSTTIGNFGSGNLRRMRATGMNASFDVSSNNLDSTALNEIYTNASATGAGKTITVTGNWGAANDTPSIATAKGWAVTG